MQQYYGSTQYLPKRQVERVNGRPGADAFPMGPDSSALLLDVSGLILWVVTTDSGGYKTVMPYDITPHIDKPAPNYDDMEARIKKLEDLIYAANASNSSATGSSRNGTAKRSADESD